MEPTLTILLLITACNYAIGQGGMVKVLFVFSLSDHNQGYRVERWLRLWN